MNNLIYMIAGEESGDIYGSQLIAELSCIKSDLIFKGIGGPRMIENGLENTIVPMKDISVIGLWEVVKKYNFFKNLQKKVENEINSLNPNIIIFIDYAGFNLSIIKRIRKNTKSTIVYYAAPQAWAWKEKRVNILKKYVDSLICLFPFEKKWFNQRGVKAKYFGHPIVSQQYQSDKSALKKELGLNPKMKLLTLFPGSRKQEYSNHFQIMKDAATIIKLKNQNIQLAVGIAQDIDIDYIDKDIHIEKDNPQKLLNASDLAIVVSGTATIEAALYDVPMVVIYKLSFLSWLLLSLLVRTKYISMVNIILDPENATDLQLIVADINNDSLINILDVISLVNIILDSF